MWGVGYGLKGRGEIEYVADLDSGICPACGAVCWRCFLNLFPASPWLSALAVDAEWPTHVGVGALSESIDDERRVTTWAWVDECDRPIDWSADRQRSGSGSLSDRSSRCSVSISAWAEIARRNSRAARTISGRATTLTSWKEIDQV